MKDGYEKKEFFKKQQLKPLISIFFFFIYKIFNILLLFCFKKNIIQIMSWKDNFQHHVSENAKGRLFQKHGILPWGLYGVNILILLWWWIVRWNKILKYNIKINEIYNHPFKYFWNRRARAAGLQLHSHIVRCVPVLAHTSKHAIHIVFT